MEEPVMTTFENLYSRRSIRNFNGENITEAELNEILKAACAAPVGRAMYDTLNLTVVSDKDLLSRWEKHMAATVCDPDVHPFYGAPTVILVSSAMPSAPMNNVNYSNAAIVVHNMALAATELGVGACHIWGAVGVLNGNEELVQELKIPEGMVPCCAIALGKTNEKYEVRDIPENRIRMEYIK